MCFDETGLQVLGSPMQKPYNQSQFSSSLFISVGVEYSDMVPVKLFGGRSNKTCRVDTYLYPCGNCSRKVQITTRHFCMTLSPCDNWTNVCDCEKEVWQMGGERDLTITTCGDGVSREGKRETRVKTMTMLSPQ